MSELDVDGFRFTFPEGWQSAKYDDWAYYRNRWSRMWDGIKSVDVLAVAPDQMAWLIEVKDYSVHQRTKPSELAQEIAQKVFDTLAAILPAAVNANDADEKAMAASMKQSIRLRVLLHLELPPAHTGVASRTINPANILQQLKQRLKPIDPHPMVVERVRMNGVPWQVKRLPQPPS